MAYVESHDQCFVEDKRQVCLPIDAEASDTIDNGVANIQEKEGKSPNQKCLILAGECLELGRVSQAAAY